MKALTETIIGLFDLAEAEGRLLQQKVVQTLIIALLMLIAAMLATLAVALFITAFYQFLIAYWSPPLTLLSVGLVSLLLAGILVWIALRTRRLQ